MKTHPTSFGVFLQQKRRSKGLSQEALASLVTTRLGVIAESKRISRIECGADPTLEELAAFAVLLNFSIDDALSIDFRDSDTSKQAVINKLVTIFKEKRAAQLEGLVAFCSE